MGFGKNSIYEKCLMVQIKYLAQNCREIGRRKDQCSFKGAQSTVTTTRMERNYADGTLPKVHSASGQTALWSECAFSRGWLGLCLRAMSAEGRVIVARVIRWGPICFQS